MMLSQSSFFLKNKKDITWIIKNFVIFILLCGPQTVYLHPYVVKAEILSCTSGPAVKPDHGHPISHCINGQWKGGLPSRHQKQSLRRPLTFIMDQRKIWKYQGKQSWFSFWIIRLDQSARYWEDTRRNFLVGHTEKKHRDSGWTFYCYFIYYANYIQNLLCITLQYSPYILTIILYLQKRGTKWIMHTPCPLLKCLWFPSDSMYWPTHMYYALPVIP